MKQLGLFSVFLACASLMSCSRLLQLTVFNNTGASMEMLAVRGNGEIASNAFNTVQFPGTGRTGRYSLLRIAGGGCEYLYDLEKAGYPYDEAMSPTASDRGVQVQVEKDFKIDLLPASYAGDVPVSDVAVLKREGFPLRPVAKKCVQG